jgi:hypothetical protein
MKPDIVSDIDEDIGGCYTPISGYPIWCPILLIPISGVAGPDIGIPDMDPHEPVSPVVALLPMFPIRNTISPVAPLRVIGWAQF